MGDSQTMKNSRKFFSLEKFSAIQYFASTQHTQCNIQTHMHTLSHRKIHILHSYMLHKRDPLIGNHTLAHTHTHTHTMDWAWETGMYMCRCTCVTRWMCSLAMDDLISSDKWRGGNRLNQLQYRFRVHLHAVTANRDWVGTTLGGIWSTCSSLSACKWTCWHPQVYVYTYVYCIQARLDVLVAHVSYRVTYMYMYSCT